MLTNFGENHMNCLQFSLQPLELNWLICRAVGATHSQEQQKNKVNVHYVNAFGFLTSKWSYIVNKLSF